MPDKEFDPQQFVRETINKPELKEISEALVNIKLFRANLPQDDPRMGQCLKDEAGARDVLITLVTKMMPPEGAQTQQIKFADTEITLHSKSNPEVVAALDHIMETRAQIKNTLGKIKETPEWQALKEAAVKETLLPYSKKEKNNVLDKREAVTNLALSFLGKEAKEDQHAINFVEKELDKMMQYEVSNEMKKIDGPQPAEREIKDKTQSEQKRKTSEILLG